MYGSEGDEEYPIVELLQRPTAARARRVLPVPAGPVRVRRRTPCCERVLDFLDLAPPAHEGRGLQGKVVGAGSQES